MGVGKLHEIEVFLLRAGHAGAAGQARGDTAPPRPASLRNSLRSIDPLIAVSFWNKTRAGLTAGPTLQDRGSRAFIPEIFFLSQIPRVPIQFAPLPPEESRGAFSRFDRNRGSRRDRRQDAAPRARPRGALPASGSVILGILVADPGQPCARGLARRGGRRAIGRDALRWILGPVVPRHGGVDADPGQNWKRKSPQSARLGAFRRDARRLFLVEMGDKTQIATAALAARYASIAAVLAGTTLGMMLADRPAVYSASAFCGGAGEDGAPGRGGRALRLLGALALIDAG